MEGEVRVRQGTVEPSILGLESAALGRSIALADGTDERVQRAAESLLEVGAAPVLPVTERPINSLSRPCEAIPWQSRLPRCGRGWLMGAWRGRPDRLLKLLDMHCRSLDWRRLRGSSAAVS